MLDPEQYKRFTGVASRDALQGGQELILPEIVSLLGEINFVYLPFPSNGLLGRTVWSLGKQLYVAHDCHQQPPKIEIGRAAIYFGTPTIVNDVPLFPLEPSAQKAVWTKDQERAYVTWLCEAARGCGFARIISGLGSGDISPEERASDMGGAKVVCMKDFGLFQDWVLVKDLK